MANYTDDELDRLAKEYYGSTVHVSSNDTVVTTGKKQTRGLETHPLYHVSFKFASMLDISDVTIGELARFYDESYYFDTKDAMSRSSRAAEEFKSFARDRLHFPGSFVMVHTYTGIVVANDPGNRYMSDAIAGDVAVEENGQMRLFDDHDHPIKDLIPMVFFETKQSEETCESLLAKMRDTARTLSLSETGTYFVPVAKSEGYFSTPYIREKKIEVTKQNMDTIKDRLKTAESLVIYNIDKSEGRRFDYGN